jgi:GH35 family endo-1,4-beta-xylanase
MKQYYFVPLLLLAWVFAAEAATLNGNAIALRSTGQASGTSWILDRNGYVGTYITLAQPGNVTIDIAADGTGLPSMGLAVADSKTAFTVTAGSRTYSATYNLPAGTHFVRTELNNDRGIAGRQLKINGLNISSSGASGATFANANTNELALTASDTYIANYRKGNASMTLPGLAPGTPVTVRLKRIAFDFGAGIHGGFLHDNPTTAEQNYQERVNQNFNTIVTAGPGFWYNNEPTQGNVDVSHMNQLAKYASAHNMHTRLHTLLFEYGDPAWVKSLKSNAVQSSSSKSSLTNSINSRTAYFIGDQNAKFDEIDVYNESYTNGQQGDPDSYWNLYGASGVADIYAKSQTAAANAGYAPRLFVNDGDQLIDPNYANGFAQHLESIRSVRDAVHGIGLQMYESNVRPNLASQFMANIQNLNVQGLPEVLTEFGTFSNVSANDSATILGQAMRLMFGNPQSTGFINWDWTKEDNGEGQWAPNAALYTVSTGSWNDFTITPAGKVWQDMMGIQDWDGNSSNGWTTQLTTTVGLNGAVNFNGYYGDYVLTANGVNYSFTFKKKTISGLGGDFNNDGKVNVADYILWRNGGPLQNDATPGVQPADYVIWRTNFGKMVGKGAETETVPEPSILVLSVAALTILAAQRRKTAS